ncbi:MAG TPA: CocE/NonD family hydrolase C-terminal non-catalytic domain-containing protein, partial [Gemmatimonadales bacterium]|nr:CocE/NonD family hydrolase C-terminal non-catalytic domain-containing protein [Gemmatimonadales bacterium]
LVPNAVEQYEIPFPANDHAFRAGHRIMVQVQSTWFPLYDRNPQTWVPNIFQAKPEDYRAQTHRIWRTRESPSHLVLPLVN